MASEVYALISNYRIALRNIRYWSYAINEVMSTRITRRYTLNVPDGSILHIQMEYTKAAEAYHRAKDELARFLEIDRPK